MNTVVETVIRYVTVTNAISSFLSIALMGKAEQTKIWYRDRLSLLASVIGKDRPLSEILEIDLIAWRESIEKRNLSPDTIHGYVMATRRLFRWLFKCGIISMDLTTELYLPRLPRRGRKGISDENAQRILDEAERHSTRDFAMLLFMASTSARRGGVAGLLLTDLRLDQSEPFCRQARVFEKGQKERTVIMDALTISALRVWLAIRPAGSDHVFVSVEGMPLTAEAVSEVVDRYKRRLGLVGNCSPHQWRHRWFRRMISNRMPLAQAAQLGGHESVDITYRYYGQFAFDELAEAYDRYFKP